MKGLIQLILSACGVVLIMALVVSAEPPVSQQAQVEQAASGRMQSQAQYVHEMGDAVRADAARTDAQANLTEAQAKRGLVEVQIIDADTNRKSAEALAGALTTQSEQTAKVIQSQQEQNANLANALVIQQAQHDVAQRAAAEQAERLAYLLAGGGILLLAGALGVYGISRLKKPTQTMHIQGPMIRVLETNQIGEWLEIEGIREPVFRAFSQPQIGTTKRK